MRNKDAFHALVITKANHSDIDQRTLDLVDLELALTAIHDEENRQRSTEIRLLDLEGRATKLEKKLGIEPDDCRRLKHEWDSDNGTAGEVVV